jgi:nucleotide-binding universal stress UspA family protein
MKILIPTDFSKTAEKAINYAIKFIPPEKNEFILYHSFVPFESGFYSHKLSQHENKETESILKRRLDKIAEALRKSVKVINLSTHIARGVEAGCMLSFARKQKADLIVMGTTGTGGLKGKLIGSVASAVMKESLCPVITIPEKHKVKPIRNIVFATDYELKDIEPIRFITRIANYHKAKIELRHFETSKPSNNDSSRLSENYKRTIERTIRYDKLTFRSSKVSDIQEALQKLSRQKDIDIMAMTTHKRKGFFNVIFDKSRTQKVAISSTVPLLCFPVS